MKIVNAENADFWNRDIDGRFLGGLLHTRLPKTLAKLRLYTFFRPSTIKWKS